MKLKSLFAAMELEADNCTVISLGGDFTLAPTDHSALSLINQAEAELKSQDSGMALKSCKQAVQYILDQLLFSLGYHSANWSIDKKLNHIIELGFINPTIERNLPTLKALLKTQAKKPQPKLLEEYLNVANLSVLHFIQLFSPLPDKLQIIHSELKDAENPSRYITLSLERSDNGVIYAGLGRSCMESALELRGHCSLTNEEPLFKSTLKLAIALHTSFQVTQTFDEFIANLSD